MQALGDSKIRKIFFPRYKARDTYNEHGQLTLTGGVPAPAPSPYVGGDHAAEAILTLNSDLPQQTPGFRFKACLARIQVVRCLVN